MKKYTLIGMLFAMSVIATLVLAIPNTDLVPATNEQADVQVIIPVHAVQVADNVFSLGSGVDVDGRLVEGFLFVDKKKENAKPDTECGNGICEPGENSKKCPSDCPGNGGEEPTSTCYAFFAKGARWKETEQYITGNGIDTTVTETSLNTWDTEVSFDVFGPRNVSGTPDGADEVNPDGKNEVMSENLGAGNTIAYAIVWGIFIGPPRGRELVEWDVVFNSYYPFGDADVSITTVMDYQNIATHEFGHALGLAHPGDTCTEETMYRFAAFNETKKRTLEAGDITGITKLYS